MSFRFNQIEFNGSKGEEGCGAFHFILNCKVGLILMLEVDQKIRHVFEFEIEFTWIRIYNKFKLAIRKINHKLFDEK